MPTALLRYCACSILSIALALDSASQKQHIKRRELKINIDTAVVGESQKETPPTQERFSREDLLRALHMLNNANYTRADTGAKWIICEYRSLDIEDFVDAEFKLDDLNYSEPITEITPDFTITNGINKPKVADAYPFISGDGLRLYFTSNREDGIDKLFISTRKSIADSFGEPKVLIPGIADYIGVSLTADELTLCTASKGEMYISMRANKEKEFPKPEKLEGAKSDYHLGPAISPDGKKIIVLVQVDGKDAISIYKRTGPYTVEYINTKTFADGSEPGPGQFSKDGLSYYFTIETDSSEQLWRYAGLSGDYSYNSRPEKLPLQMKDGEGMGQPSLNDDGSILVFITSNGDWNDDEIRLANLSTNNFDYPQIADSIKNGAGYTAMMIHSPVQPNTIEYSTSFKQDMSAGEKPTRITLLESSVVGSKAYPNPFITSVDIELEEVPAHGAVFSLYDASGKVVREQRISNNLTNVQLGKLPSGSYVYRIVDDKGKLISSDKLLKIQ